MAVVLDKEIIELLEAQDSLKVIASNDEKGVPNVTVSEWLHLDENHNLVHFELLEAVQNNKNLIHSLWFNRKVAINIRGKNDISYQIKGKVTKSVVNGPHFQKHYISLREKLGDVDLSTVWIIQPEEIINETYRVRKEYEETNHPYFIHLDRLAKN